MTLAEDDPVKFDPAFWIDVFKRTQSNATCLSAGGYIAYYPSQVPLHYVSKFIGDKDPFGALVDGARKLDMHVMARVDPHAIHEDAADAHPEWIAVDRPTATPRRHWAFPDVWVTCAYGDYNSEFMPEGGEGDRPQIRHRRRLRQPLAGPWRLLLRDCRGPFRAFAGFDLPLGSDANDPAWQAWTHWRRKVLTDVIAQWDDAGESDPAARELHPQHGRRLADGIRPLRHREALPVPRRRPPGPPRRRDWGGRRARRQAHARRFPASGRSC